MSVSSVILFKDDKPVGIVTERDHVRQQLKPGDIVFYLPKKKSIMESGLDDYVCTGILIV